MKELIFPSIRALLGIFAVITSKQAYWTSSIPDYIGKAFQYRTDCDYEDFFIVDRADAELQYQHALEFYEAIENYLNMETE